ncbi:MAG TPA: LamG-like jellyroll fold domain-containing protein, partial [Sandaracinaceae bacterium]
AGPRCPMPRSSALDLDGEDDHIALGVVPALGLAQFTIEAWVRRDGKGRTAGTGVGGIDVVPIVAKGRGEDDGSNIDTNYAFGFVGEVIGADFEDMATGANHPVIGRTPIPYGEWHHVAVTYDGARWNLYVDGRLDGSRVVNATPRADSVQPVGIGTTFNSRGVRAGALDGAIDEVRIWDRARTAEEIAASVYEPPDSLVGLVAAWAIDESEGTTVLDSLGVHDGTIEAPTYVSPGAPIGQGRPPSASAATPSDGATVGAGATLSVSVADEDSEHLTVRFYARPVTEAEDFTIVVLPDTQNYTRNGNERFFYDQTQWIMDNAEAYNIVAVLHNGDVINDWDVESQWRIADRAMRTLETPSERYPDGMPTGIAVGNHDLRGGLDVFNRWFGLDRYAHRAYYGGHYRSGNNDSYITFSAGGLDFVAVNLKYDTDPDPGVHAWARQVFESHPNSFGILNTHYLLTSAGEFGPQGQAIYRDLADVPNLHLMTCGHISTERRRRDTHAASGHTITTMLADYQSRANGGGGMMRIWEFSPANDELTVRTYSPTQDLWETDGESEFTISVDLSRAGGPFMEVGEVEVGPGTASIELVDLMPATRYEWYAVVEDCAHRARTEVSSFTTSP